MTLLTIKRAPLMALTAMLALGGCGSDDISDDPGASSDAGGDDADAGGDDGPLYLVHSAVQSTDDRVNYFTATGDLGAEIDLTYDESLELPGRARLYAQPGSDFFAIGDSESLTLTRYELDGSALVAGDSVSLQPFGVTSLGAQAVLFASPTRAYYKDSGQAQIVVWNPAEMAVEDTLELPAELLREGYDIGVSDWVSREGEAYFTVSWYTPEYDRVAPGVALVRIDTETDELTVTEDERCRGIGTAARVGDELYFFSDVINGFGHAIYPDDGGQADCILRVAAGETTFDPDYLGSVSEALPEGQVGTVVSVGEGGELWAQMVDLEVAPTEPGSTYGEWYADGWSWVHLPLSTLTDPVVVTGEPGAYSSFIFAAESGFYVAQTEADYSETTLLDLGSGSPEPGISFPGFSLDIARIR